MACFNACQRMSERAGYLPSVKDHSLEMTRYFLWAACLKKHAKRTQFSNYKDEQK